MSNQVESVESIEEIIPEENNITVQEEEVSEQKGLKGKKLCARRNDSLDIESRSVGGHHAYGHGSKALLLLLLNLNFFSFLFSYIKNHYKLDFYFLFGFICRKKLYIYT